MTEPMDLTVTTAPAAFILTTQTSTPFVLSGGAGAAISLQLNPSLAGGVDLRGPQGEPALRALSGFVGGLPNDDEVLCAAESPYTFDVSPSESKAEALEAATAITVFTIKVEGVTVGTITFGAGQTVGVVAYTSTTITKGDLVTIHGPAIADATLANITFLIA